MSDIKELLDEAVGLYEPRSDQQGVEERVERRKQKRRLAAGSVALAVFIVAGLFAWTAFQPGEEVRPTPAGEPACPRVWHQTVSESPSGAFLSISALPDGEAWAVGPDEAAPLGSETLIHRWDGSAWQRVPSPNGASGPQAVNALNDVAAISSDDVWAVGEFVESPGWGTNPSQVLVEHWDGSAWTIEHAPSPLDRENQLNAVAVAAPDDVWAVGFAVAGNVATTLIEHWDGRAWSVVETPDLTSDQSGASLNSLEIVSPTDIWAGGSQPSGGLIEHWDGTEWTVVEIPQPSDHLFVAGIDASSASDVWAVGWSFEESAAFKGSPVVLNFDGAEWDLVDIPATTKSVVPLAVAVAAPNDVWVTGWMGDQTRQIPLALQWNGETWRYVDIGPDEGQMLGAAIADDSVWFVGRAGGTYDGNGYMSGDRPLALSGDCAAM
jgi:hypothetical protein